MFVIDEGVSHGVSKITIVPTERDTPADPNTAFWFIMGVGGIMALIVLIRKYIRTGKVIAKGA